MAAVTQAHSNPHQHTSLLSDDGKRGWSGGSPKPRVDESTRLLPLTPIKGSPSVCNNAAERVHPVSYHSTDINARSESTATKNTADSASGTRPGVMSKILTKAVSMSSAQFGHSLLGARDRSSSTQGYSALHTTRHNSILRMGTHGNQEARGMKKSASVDFSLHDEPGKKRNKERRFSGSLMDREAPRRLTQAEKEDLYRVRPDLEIGPIPFYKEQMAELHRRNQRRVLFAIFGGIGCLAILMVLYYLLTTE